MRRSRWCFVVWKKKSAQNVRNVNGAGEKILSIPIRWDMKSCLRWIITGMIWIQKPSGNWCSVASWHRGFSGKCWKDFMMQDRTWSGSTGLQEAERDVRSNWILLRICFRAVQGNWRKVFLRMNGWSGGSPGSWKSVASRFCIRSFSWTGKENTKFMWLRERCRKREWLSGNWCGAYQPQQDDGLSQKMTVPRWSGRIIWRLSAGKDRHIIQFRELPGSARGATAFQAIILPWWSCQVEKRAWCFLMGWVQVKPRAGRVPWWWSF